MVLVGSSVAGGAGGLIGARLAEVVGYRLARRFQQQLDRGGLLLRVRTWSPQQEAHADEIPSRHSRGATAVSPTGSQKRQPMFSTTLPPRIANAD